MKGFLLSSIISIGCAYSLYQSNKDNKNKQTIDILKKTSAEIKNCSPISKLFVQKGQ